MSSPRHVPHVERLSAAAFRRRYIAPQRPVVIKNLFEGQPISRLTTVKKACATLGNMRLKTRANYLEGLFPGNRPPTATANAIEEETLSQYAERVKSNPVLDRLCVEYKTPDEVSRLFEPPPIVRDGLADAISLLFIAAGGNAAHMHFDTDHRQVLLYQVFGHKRVVLFPPRVGKQLLPLSATSLLSMASWSEAEKRRLIDHLGGFETVLEPGDAIYMPALWWHHVEYHDFAMSFSLRFDRNDYGRFLAQLFPDVYLQNVGTRYLGKPGRAATRRFDDVRRVAIARYPNARAKHAAVRQMMETLYRELCPESFQGPYIAGLLEESETRLAVQHYERREREQGPQLDAWRA